MMKYIFSGVSWIPPTSKMELFVSLVNSFQVLTNTLKNSILEVVGPRYATYFIKLQVAGQQID